MTGKTQVDVHVAPISPMHSNFNLNRLQAGIAFTHETVDCSGEWRRSGKIPLPTATNTGTLLSHAADMKLSHDAAQTSLIAADGMLHMNLARGKERKRKEDGQRLVAREEKKEGQVCKVVQNHSMESIDTTHQLELRAECERHGLVKAGSNPELKARLKAHYESCQHSHKPGGAASDKAGTYYDSAFNPKKKQDLHAFWGAAQKKL